MKIVIRLFLAGWVVGGAAIACGGEPQVSKLLVTPAARPEPALRYRFAPAERELRAGNAAALYYRTLIQLNQDRKQWMEDYHKADEWLELPPDKLPRDDAQRLLERYAGAISEAQLGARRSEASWDVPLREYGVGTLLPEIQEVRNIARLLRLKARLAILHGDYQAAGEALQTMFSLGHHVSESGTLVSSLVGMACTGIAAEEVEQWIATPGSPNVYWALTSLPKPPIALMRGLESEQEWLAADVPYLDILGTTILSRQQANVMAHAAGKLQQYQDDGSLKDMKLSFMGKQVTLPDEMIAIFPALHGYSTAKRQLIARGRSAEEVETMPAAQVIMLRWVETYRELLDEIIIWGDRPFPETGLAARDLDARVHAAAERSEGYLASLLLPAVSAVFTASARTDQYIEMLRTAEAVRLFAAAHNGRLPANLAEIGEVPVPIDPATNQPFVYEFKDGTATLRSVESDAVLYDRRFEITVRK